MEHCPPSTIDIHRIPTHITTKATIGLACCEMEVFLSNIKAVTITMEKMTKATE